MKKYTHQAQSLSNGISIYLDPADAVRPEGTLSRARIVRHNWSGKTERVGTVRHLDYGQDGGGTGDTLVAVVR